MALNIKNPEVEEDARWLARRRKQGLTEVVRDALRREVEREKRIPRRDDDFAAFKRRIDTIVERFNSRPLLDRRTPDEIIGYNDQGHFD